MQASAVIYVQHLEQMRTFYERCFGLAASHVEDSFCVLQSDAWRLSLVSVPEAIALASPPSRREDVPVKLGFVVESIADVRQLAAALGGQVDADATGWEFDGTLHCDGVDPEGNVIQLLQSLAR